MKISRWRRASGCTAQYVTQREISSLSQQEEEEEVVLYLDEDKKKKTGNKETKKLVIALQKKTVDGMSPRIKMGTNRYEKLEWSGRNHNGSIQMQCRGGVQPRSKPSGNHLAEMAAMRTEAL